MPSHPSLVELSRLLRRARRRLRVRGALRGAAVGAWGGVVCAASATAVGAWMGGGLVGMGIGGVVGVGMVGLGGLLGAALPVLSDRELALLLDRRCGTHEAFVTALHVASAPSGRSDEVLTQLTRVLDREPDLREALPLRLPRHLRLLPLAALIAPLGLLVPQAPAVSSSEPSALTEEGDRLGQRLEDLVTDEASVLPSELTDEVEELARGMQLGEISEEQARQRLAELQERIAQFEHRLEASDLLADLEEAARELDAGATKGLADALEQGDLAGAAEAAEDLADQLGQASPEERRRAADALSRAGQELSQSKDPALREAGEAMQDVARDLRSQGEPGSSSSPGDQGEGAGASESTERLSRELDRAQELSEKLKRDREALRQSQELNGALEAGRQRLGGEPSVPGGETSEGDGQGQEGAEGQGGGEGAQAAAGRESRPGAGHTWEDEGEFEGSANDGGDGQRQSGRTEGVEVDDFERLYASIRMEGAEFLLASEEGQLDAAGKADPIRIRRTSTDERARLPALSLPVDYASAATEAIRSEQVPPGYREAVKTYFDSME